MQQAAVNDRSNEAPLVPILGGGPAGMSCALWLFNYGLSPVIIEPEPALGGMMRRNPYPNPWLLGRPGALERANAAKFARHIESINVRRWLGASPRLLRRLDESSFAVEIEFLDGRQPQQLTCAALVIATGTDFAGAEWLDEVGNAYAALQAGHLHVGPTWPGEPGVDVGERVALVGGGDNAFDVARILIERGAKVTIVMRSANPRAQALLVNRIQEYAAAGRAEILPHRTVRAVENADGKVRLQLSDGSVREADNVGLLLGYHPNTSGAWLRELQLERDAAGYLTVGQDMETSCRGVFAVGDVANPRNPSTPTALASGTIAARAIERRLRAMRAAP